MGTATSQTPHQTPSSPRSTCTPGQVGDNAFGATRDHLADFLSWMRTSLAGLGILVAELVETEGTAAEILGLLAIVLGAAAVTSTSPPGDPPSR